MEIIPDFTNKKEWEEFLLANSQIYPYFQSWTWMEVQKNMGALVFRVALADSSTKELLGVCAFTLVRARRGTYLHLRHGPVLKRYTKNYLDFLLEYIQKLARSKNASFLRLSPLLPKIKEYQQLFKEPKFLQSPIHRMDGEVCWVLPIEKSEDELLMEMRKSHRYLIRKSTKTGIEVVRGKNMSDIEAFLSIYKKLALRKHFIPHKGVVQEFEEFSKEDNCLLLLAKYEGKYIAGALVIFTPVMAIYRHGASLEEYKEIPASYVLQWEAIKEAKKRGLKLYNFWGIAPQNEKNHPWAGLTLFKTGFGGHILEFLHAHDMPLNLMYWKTYMIELFTMYKKGY